MEIDMFPAVSWYLKRKLGSGLDREARQSLSGPHHAALLDEVEAVDLRMTQYRKKINERLWRKITSLRDLITVL